MASVPECSFIFLPLLLLATSVFPESSLAATACTKNGTARGSLVQIPTLQDVCQFTGIPYAEVPIGERRFLKPVYKTAWNGTLDATRFPHACVQAHQKGLNMSEDCLYLNIWVPRNAFNAKASLPVLVFIHGGAFKSGSTMANTYNASVLAAYGNIIVVSVAYRLGSLGFTYFGSKEAPGNMGLWDQQAGLKWIYENIDKFGGNNKAITTGGESAGSASTAFHLLSPSSWLFFQKAIMQSGSANTPWAVYSKEEALAVSKRLLNQVASGRCASFPTPSAQLKCLRSVDADEFPKADSHSFAIGHGNGVDPVIDGDFVLRDPKQMVLDGDFADVPILIGTNKDEASYFFMVNKTAMEITNKAEHPPYTIDKSDYDLLLEIVMNILTAIPNKLDQSIIEAIEEQYWPSNNGSDPIDGPKAVQTVIAAVTDYAFYCPTFALAKEASNSSKRMSSVFVYEFAHKSSLKPFPEWMGVPHSAILPFMFGEPLASYAAPLNYSAADKLFTKVMMNYWANFVTNGTPNVVGTVTLDEWPSFSTGSCPILVLDSPPFNTTTCEQKVQNCLFWDKVFPSLTDAFGNNI